MLLKVLIRAIFFILRPLTACFVFSLENDGDYECKSVDDGDDNDEDVGNLDILPNSRLDFDPGT